jgi:F-type H+-transporting ATPase subunit gamma
LLTEIASQLRGTKIDFTHPLLEVRPIKKTGVLVITSDKGLCGALNTNLLRDVLKNDGPDKVYVTIGRKGRQFLARLGKNLAADFEIKDHFSFRDSKQVSKFLLQQFAEGKMDAIEIYYSHFVNTINQQPQKMGLLPIGLSALGAEKDEKSEAAGQADFLFEPNPEELLGRLLPFYVHQQVYQAILDAKASEHSARMVAMKNASDNAKQIIKDLTLEYNKARQSGITREILEIATAQAALN